MNHLGKPSTPDGMFHMSWDTIRIFFLQKSTQNLDLEGGKLFTKTLEGEGGLDGPSALDIKNEQIRFLHQQWSQLVTTWHFLLVRGAALEVRHHPVAQLGVEKSL